MSRKLSVPDQHALKIAKKTLLMNKVMAHVMGGPTHAQARRSIYRLTGKSAPILPEHGDYESAKAVLQPNGKRI